MASPQDPFRSSADTDTMAQDALPQEPSAAHTRRTSAKAAGSAVHKGLDPGVSPKRLPPLTLPIGADPPSQSQPVAGPHQRDTTGSTEAKKLLDQVSALLKSHDEDKQQPRSILQETSPALGLDPSPAAPADQKPPRPAANIPERLQQQTKRDSTGSITAALDDRLAELSKEQTQHDQSRAATGAGVRGSAAPPATTAPVPASALASKLQNLAAIAPNRVASPVSHPPSNPPQRSTSNRNTRSTFTNSTIEDPTFVPGGTNTVGGLDPAEVATGYVGADFGPFPTHIRQASSTSSPITNVGPNPGARVVPPLAMVATGNMPKHYRSTPSPQQLQLQRELSERRPQSSSPTVETLTTAGGDPSPVSVVSRPLSPSAAPYAAQMRPPAVMTGHQGTGGYGIASSARPAGATAAAAATGPISYGHAHNSSTGHFIPGSIRSDSVHQFHNSSSNQHISSSQPLLGKATGAAPLTVSGSAYGPGRYPFSPSTSGSNMHSKSYLHHRESAPFMPRPGAVNTPGMGGWIGGGGGGLGVENLLWDEKAKDVDDYLHNPDPHSDGDDQGCSTMSGRGACNVAVLAIVIAGCLALFAGYPLIAHFTRETISNVGAANLGGTNGTGQVPDLKIFQLIDVDTPADAYKFTSPVEGRVEYDLVFSDEFNEEGRTFWPGDDPFWEAVDLWYGATHDYQWYSPEALNTTGGALQITMEALPNHNLNFRSGMLQSWNKFCYQGGYIEFSAILPGGPTTKGYWPAAWMMGNLARPGYLGSTDGMWPYSYSSCDTGILPDQLFLNGTGPEDTLTNFSRFSSKGPPERLSLLPGMRLPSCTCAGEDHPGPNVNTARSTPELDVFEVTQQGQHSYASQTFQIAPFDSAQQWKNTTALVGGDAVLFGTESEVRINDYKGTPYQESVSGYAMVPDDGYMDVGQRFVKYGVEYFPDWNEDGQGTITWYIDGKATWTARGSTLDPAPSMDVGRRLFPVEPMSIIMNLGISSGFQQIDWNPLTGVTFPAVMLFDYVRLYQQQGEQRLSCDPPDHPTSAYIQTHPDIYYNPNLTVYPREKYGWPKNRLTGC